MNMVVAGLVMFAVGGSEASNALPPKQLTSSDALFESQSLLVHGEKTGTNSVPDGLERFLREKRTYAMEGETSEQVDCGPEGIKLNWSDSTSSLSVEDVYDPAKDPMWAIGPVADTNSYITSSTNLSSVYHQDYHHWANIQNSHWHYERFQRTETASAVDGQRVGEWHVEYDCNSWTWSGWPDYEWRISVCANHIWGDSHNHDQHYVTNYVVTGTLGVGSWNEIEQSNEVTTEDLYHYTKTKLNSTNYPSFWSLAAGFAQTDFSTNDLQLDLGKTRYKVKVNTGSLDSGKRYNCNWVERYTSEDGTVTTDAPKTFSFIANGSQIESPVYEIQPPESEGTITPLIIDPDFIIDDVFVKDALLAPGDTSTTEATASISNLKDTGLRSTYLSRIRWKVVAIKDGKTFGVTVAGQGVANNMAKAAIRAGEESGKVYIMAYDSANPGVYAFEKIDISCGSCPGGICGDVENECVALTVGLGKAVDGSSAGSLTILEKNPDAYIYSPVTLQYPVDNIEYSEVLRDAYGSLRQVKTASVFADMIVPESLLLVTSNETTVVTNYTGYEIRLYSPDAVGAFSNDVYQIAGGSDPYKIWRIEDPDLLENDYHQVKISEIMNGETSSKTNVNLFTWNETAEGWDLSKGGGLQVVKRSSVVQGDMRVETMLVTDASGNDASKTFSFYRTYFWGEALVKEIQDPDGAALVTDYTYYTDESDAARMGKMDSVKYPDGSWVKYVYDNEGRRTSVWSPWLDVTLEQTTASNCRRKDTGYEPVDAADLAQTNGYVILRPRLVTEYIEGASVSKTAFAYYTNSTERIEKTVKYDNPASGSYTDPANRISTSIYHLENDANPDVADNIKQSESPDGLTTSYGHVRGDFSFDSTLYSDGAYSFTPDTNGIWLCETTTNGIVASPAGVANKTTLSVSYRNSRGAVVLSETYVYTGGTSYDRIGWTANEYDYDDPTKTYAVGHVANRYYSDGTFEENTWSSCCGLERTINRQGQVEIYNYDDLGRRYSILRAGQGNQPDIDNDYGFDAAGRQVSMIETADGLSRTTGSDYDLAGRLQSSTNEAGLVTLYTYEDGGRISTVVMSGGATQITETYIDGRTKRVYGTGTIEQTYEYGFDSSNLWTTVYTGSQGTSSPRWEKTITDAVGKTLKVERPGFGGSVVLSSVYFYDATNRLWKTEQLEGTIVKTSSITVYDELGNAIRSGLDVDLDDSLSLASMDRISDSDTSYVSTNSTWYRVGTSTTYPKDNNAEALTVSVQKSRLTGLGGSGAHGILTSESIGTDVFGNTTISQSWLNRGTKTITQIIDIPNSTQDQISTSVNGLLASVSSAASVVTQYGYDGLGRRTTVIDPRIGTSTTQYNTKGQVGWTEDTHGVRTGYTYDPDTGQRFSSSTTNGAEIATTYTEYDVRGQLVRQWGNATYPVAYDYDEFGQKTHMHTYRGGKDWDGAIWPGNSALADTSEWVYDPTTGLLTEKLYADGKGTSYTYEPDGKLETRTWERGITTTYSYFDTGERDTVDYSDSTTDITYTYYRTGQQKQVVDAQGTRVFTYTDEGQLDTETLNGSEVIDLKYDGYGRSTGYDADDASSFVGYGYDAYGRFYSIGATNGSDTSSIQYDYVPNSGLLSGYTAQAGGSAALLTVTKGYEPDRNLIVGITNQIAGGSNAGVVSSFTYMNDGLGRRTRRDDVRTAGVSPAQSYWEYGYNTRSELTNAVRHLPDTTPVAGQGKSYLYDNIGNRRLENRQSSIINRKSIYTANELNQYIARTVPSFVDVMGTATNTATVTVRDAAHADLPAPVIRQDDYFYKAYPVDNLSGAFTNDLEITAVINPSGTNDPDIVKGEVRSAFVPQTPEQYIYDDDGNLLNDGRFNYVWNAENRLITVSNQTGLVASYAYDYQGRRISKTVGLETTTFLWNGNHIIHEESSAKTNTYCWGQNDHLVSATLSGTNVFYAHDGNKNVTDLVDTSGNAVAHYEFDPYGNINVKTGVLADANPFRFSNEYYDPETGHVAYMLRYLNTSTGSWPNRDPIAEKGGLNLYGFVQNNPLSNVDQFGLYTLDDAKDSLKSKKVDPDGWFRYSKRQIFSEWYLLERKNGTWWTSLPKCPSRVTLAGKGKACNPDPEVWTDPNQGLIGSIILKIFHPGSKFEIRTRSGVGAPHGNQCTYSSTGFLIRGIPAAGTADLYGPNHGRSGFNNHQDHDVKPYKMADKLGRDYVRIYYLVRPIW